MKKKGSHGFSLVLNRIYAKIHEYNRIYDKFSRGDLRFSPVCKWNLKAFVGNQLTINVACILSVFVTYIKERLYISFLGFQDLA